MAKIVLIHGFATGIRFSVFRAPRGSDAGFSAFRKAVASGEAMPFRWDMHADATFFQSINPWYAKHVYDLERQTSESADTHQKLAAFLAREQPRTIVCHSLGCHLLLSYLQRHALPLSVGAIVFNQADVDLPEFVFPAPIESRLRAKTLRWVNTYCPWDLTLLISAIASGSRRAGLRAVAIPLVEDTFFPLFRSANIHMSAIRDPQFSKFVFSL